MLYSVTIGGTSANNTWFLSEDKYGIKYIENISIRQKIKIGNGIEEICKEVYSLNENNINIKGYELFKYIKFSNSNKNMRLTAIRLNEKENDTNQIEYHICYITFNPDEYELLLYQQPNHSSTNICQTYRTNRHGSYQGCAIQYTSAYTGLLKFSVCEKSTGEFYDFLVGVDENNIPKIVKKETTGEDLDNIKSIFISLRLGDKIKTKHFGITFNRGYIPTSIVLLNPGNGEKNLPDLSRYTRIEFDGVDALENLDNEGNQVILEEICKKNIRAITIIDLQLPKDFCWKYKIDYVFTYNPESGKVRCIKGK